MESRFETKIAACTPHGAKSIFETNLRGRVCIVMGNEDAGLNPEIINLADARAAIPMSSGIDSPNADSACTVFMCEAPEGDWKFAEIRPELLRRLRVKRI
jgi:tRNA G18 (ribose-2'-O)-methylase SpoU